MKVVHFHRKRRHNANFSIEGFYANVRNELKDKINIEYVELPFLSNGVLRRLYNLIYAAFKQGDVNHVTGDVNYLNMFFNKNKTIVTILDCGLLDRTNGFTHEIYKYFWFTLPVQKAKYIVAISEATKTEILKYVKCDPDKIKVIHVSVSPLFNRVDKDFNKEKPIILQIGAAPNKNLSRLIESVKDLSCKLIIVGKLKEDKIKLLNDYKIEYENFVDITQEELYEQYKRCDMLFFASTYEGFGMPIVEANIIGRPVLTSNLYSMPEVAGDSALLVDPYNTEAIRNGIVKIINDADYRNELISKGFKNAEKFTLEKMTNNYLSIYKLFLR
ncbi:MAG: glycosyltransferase family 4 protein [Ignavibacteriaceae bacterium]|jgi:glycosyltransferase involved in cell wall biosynthesis|nr:glycosyltransferase family 4 protein [Ignavibacteriaceae bacterium]